MRACFRKCIFGVLAASLACFSYGESSIAEQKPFTANISGSQWRAIDEIISTMGKGSVLKLGWKYFHLKDLGEQLNELTPLEFLAGIFSQPHLARYMREIRRSTYKWYGFMDGMHSKLKFEIEQHRLIEELPAFAAFLGIDSAPLLSAAYQRDWDLLVHRIIDDDRLIRGESLEKAKKKK